MDSKKLITVLKSGVVDPQTTALQLTVTTTGAQTATIKPDPVSGKTITVDWGDGTVEAFTTTANRSHSYAGAGTWQVKIGPRSAMASLENSDVKVSISLSASNPLGANMTAFVWWDGPLFWNVNQYPIPPQLTQLVFQPGTGSSATWNANTSPMPAGLTFLIISNASGFTYNANTNPLPSGLTYLTLYGLNGLTYNANTNPLPSGLTVLTLNNLSGLTWSGTLPNGIRAATVQNSASQATVDAWLYTILANKANFTYATPSLNLAGTNAAPSGTYQAADPVTSGKEAKYALIMGNGSYAPGPEWTVTTN